MNKLYISMYHYTRYIKNSRYPAIKGLEVKDFKRQLDFFEENFNIITMEVVTEAVLKGRKLPEKALLLTFDDGYIDNYTVALPLLAERGLQGSFFVPAKPLDKGGLLEVNKIHFTLAKGDEKNIVRDILDYSLKIKEKLREKLNIADRDISEELYKRYAVSNGRDTVDTSFIKKMLQEVLPAENRTEIIDILFDKYVEVSEEVLANELYVNKTQLKVMKKLGMFIGLHGYEHNHLALLTEEEQKKDLEKALSAMREFIDEDAWVMNYPYGSYNETTLRLIKSRGAVLGLTTKRGIADIKPDSALELARFDCNDFPPKGEGYSLF
jgi:hypothetical protein